MNQQNRGNSLSSRHSISHTHTLRTLKTINHRALAHLRRLHISPHLMSLAHPLLLKRSLSRNYLMCQSQRRSPLIPVFSKSSGSAITELSSNAGSSASCTSSASVPMGRPQIPLWSPSRCLSPPRMYSVDIKSLSDFVLYSGPKVIDTFAPKRICPSSLPRHP